MTSVLKMVWKVIAIRTTQSSEKPCCTNAAGPRRNSPLPIETPSAMTPGPTARNQPRP
jgi:hypothetical protein